MHMLNILIKINKYINLLANARELLKEIFRDMDNIKSLIKKNLITNHWIMINKLKLKQKFIRIGYIQIFNIMKYPKIRKNLKMN